MKYRKILYDISYTNEMRKINIYVMSSKPKTTTFYMEYYNGAWHLA